MDFFSVQQSNVENSIGMGQMNPPPPPWGSYQGPISPDYQYQSHLNIHGSPSISAYATLPQHNGHMFVDHNTPTTIQQQSMTLAGQPPANNPVRYQGLLSTYLSQMNPNNNASTYQTDPNVVVPYAPCQGQQPWNFSPCYGYDGQPPCPLVNLIDMEDFM